MNILIIDSSLQIIERITSLLLETRKNIIIHSTVSFTEAIALFNEVKPVVVLLDKDLPDNKSIELLKYINSKAVTICLSFRTDNNIEEQCKLLGADFFLDKYNDFEKIPVIITTITNNRTKY